MIRRHPVAILVLTLAALLGGCAKDMAFRKGQALPPGEGIVYGQVVVLLRGAPVKWGDGGLLHGSGTLWGHGYFRISVVPETDVQPVYQDLLTEEGAFVWRLPPGRYRMVGYEWEFLAYPVEYRASNRIGATFDVPPAGRSQYIGTLIVDLDAEDPKESLKLTQNQAVADAQLRQRGAARAEETPPTVLMTLEPAR